MTHTGPEFKEATKDFQNVKIITRNCPKCKYEMGIIFNDGKIFFDHGCDCNAFQKISPMEWDNFVDYYNHLTILQNKQQLDTLFGFE